MKGRKSHAGTEGKDGKGPKARRRRNRPRPTPKWLREQQDLDEIARARCLAILSVLSGEKPVTDVIGAAKMSRNTYYQLETKALQAMLAALMPGASPDAATGADARARIEALETKVERLERDKRRLERLLFLTRKVVRTKPLTVATGGRPRRRARRSSKSDGSASSPASTRPTTSPAPSPSCAPSPSTRTKDGVVVP